MNAQEIINYIKTSEKKTPVKLYIRENESVDYGSAKVFGAGDKIVFGDWKELGPILEANADKIADVVIENDCRNSAIPMLNMLDIPARIEPGAIIREQVGAYLGYLGTAIAPENNSIRGEETIISTPDSKVTVMVVPTNEELAIARETLRLTKK